MSTLKTNTLQNVAATKSQTVANLVDGTAKVWVDFNGTGTIAIRKSFNVSSLVDNATGDYTINYSSPVADINYTAVHGVGGGASICGSSDIATPRTVSLIRLSTFNSSGVAADGLHVSLVVFD